MAEIPDIQAQIDAAVAAATAPLNDQIGELTAQLAQRASDDAAAQLQAELDEARRDLDAKVAELTAVQSTYDQLVADLEAIEADRVEAERVEAVKAERVAAVADMGLFDDEHRANSADRWAAMSDEAWAGQVDEYKLLAEKHASIPVPSTPVTEPSTSALTAAAAEPVTSTDADDTIAVIRNRRAVANLAV